MKKELIEQLIKDGNLDNFNEKELNKLEEFADEVVVSDRDTNDIQYIDFRYHVENVGYIELYGLDDSDGINEDRRIIPDSKVRYYGHNYSELEKDEFMDIYNKNTLEHTIETIKNLSWEEFIGLQEVQIDESPSGYGNALFYNDGHIQVSIDVVAKMIDEYGEVIPESEGHDDVSLWEDEVLARELQELAILELEEEKGWLKWKQVKKWLLEDVNIRIKLVFLIGRTVGVK